VQGPAGNGRGLQLRLLYQAQLDDTGHSTQAIRPFIERR
jgi:hypothetical protein